MRLVCAGCGISMTDAGYLLCRCGRLFSLPAGPSVAAAGVTLVAAATAHDRTRLALQDVVASLSAAVLELDAVDVDLTLEDPVKNARTDLPGMLEELRKALRYTCDAVGHERGEETR